jgi:hypothetical protein
MFGFLYEMLGGEHEECAPRRAAPVTAAPGDGRGVGDFVVDHGDTSILAGPEPWLQRGERPGETVNVAQQEEGLTVAEELRRLAAAIEQRHTPKKPGG